MVASWADQTADMHSPSADLALFDRASPAPNRRSQWPPFRRFPARIRRGATVVEFAIVAPILFLLILATIEIGRGLMVVHLLNNAARQGCRTGIIEGKSTSQITAAVTNALQAQGISGDSVTVQVNDGSADASTAKAGDEITVQVSVPVSKVTWLPGGQFLSGNLSGKYTLRRE